MATGVESAKILIQLALCWTNAGLVLDYQGSIYGHNRRAAARFVLDPTKDLSHIFQARDALKMQACTVHFDGSQTTRLSIPTQVDANECFHKWDRFRAIGEHSSNRTRRYTIRQEGVRRPCPQ